MKCQLSQEEHELVEKGATIFDADETSPSMFIVTTLELEEAQYVYFVPSIPKAYLETDRSSRLMLELHGQ